MKNLKAALLASLWFAMTGQTAAALEPALFLEVSLTCPAGRNGAFELLSENLLGQREKLKVRYRDRKAVWLSLLYCEPDAMCRPALDWHLHRLADDDLLIAKSIVARADAATVLGCGASGYVRKSYDQSLADNRGRLSAARR